MGALLEARGLKVTAIKLDPYINVDPGTMSPFQHGEVFVTDDGAETDLDLGHYERFIGTRMGKLNNFSTGQVYETVIANERQALVLARCGGAVCGLIALDYMYYLPLGTTTCRITAMVVTPEAQGRGLGKQLLREAERRARAGGAARLEITSGSQRVDAHAFYRACGYSDGTLRFVKHLGC